MDYRLLERADLELLKEIDRSEIVNYKYIYRKDGYGLDLVREDHDILGWDREEVESYILRMGELLTRKSWILGSFDQGRIVGLGALDSKLFGQDMTRLKLDLLYISQAYRGQGIGRELVEKIKEVAKNQGAQSLYISATPFKASVDFYKALGAVLADPVDEKLYSLEPEDIHLEIFL